MFVCSIEGVPLPFVAGEIDFGGLVTNGQHCFYQTHTLGDMIVVHNCLFEL